MEVAINNKKVKTILYIFLIKKYGKLQRWGKPFENLIYCKINFQ